MLFKAKHVLVTAGATYEPIDPVRFLGNRSSGKMGIALVHALLKRGAFVYLVMGEHLVDVPEHPNLKVIFVKTALEMCKAVLAWFPGVDWVFKTAAVADFRPKIYQTSKIKKQDQQDQIDFSLELVKNPDILKTIGLQKKHQKLVGFALETEQGLGYAYQKMKDKNLDFICLNFLNALDSGPLVDTNSVVILSKSYPPVYCPKTTKLALAEIICQTLEDF